MSLLTGHWSTSSYVLWIFVLTGVLLLGIYAVDRETTEVSENSDQQMPGLHYNSLSKNLHQDDKTIPLIQGASAEYRDNIHTQDASTVGSNTHVDSNHVNYFDDALGISDLTVTELNALHARQLLAIEQLPINMDEIVIPDERDGEGGVTYRELLALHKKQLEQNANAYSPGEIVAPDSEGGSQGLTLREVRALHEQQLNQLKSLEYNEQTVTLPGNPGPTSVYKPDNESLHEIQLKKSAEGVNILDAYIAPLPENGEAYLTVDEVRELHKRQTYN